MNKTFAAVVAAGLMIGTTATAKPPLSDVAFVREGIICFRGGFFVNLTGIAGNVALEPDQTVPLDFSGAEPRDKKGAPCLIFAKLSLMEMRLR